MRVIIVVGLLLLAVALGVYFLWPTTVNGPQNDIVDNSAELLINVEAGSSTKTPPPASFNPIYEGPKPTGPMGRVIFTIRDEAAFSGNLERISLTVKELTLLGPSGSVTLTNIPRTFNVLALYKEGKAALLIDTALPHGTYNQIKLVLGSIEIVETGSTPKIALLPANEITVPAKLEVNSGQIAVAEYDFILSDSLHKSTDGTFLFFPVVKIRTLSNVSDVQITRNASINETVIDVFDGVLKYTAVLGMDEKGVLKQNFKFGQYSQFEVVDGIIKIK
jgi:hypothetical protein